MGHDLHDRHDLDHPADHDDFGGLDRDLPRLLGRRKALMVLGAGSLVALAGCASNAATGSGASTTTAAGSSSSSSSSSTSAKGSTSTTARAATSTTAAATDSADAAADPTSAIPQETAGPYPGDGSNGPNVLRESGVVRSDIRSSFGDASETVEGIPLTLRFTVLDLDNGAAPLAGAALYAWHCNKDGEYSMYSQGVTDQNWLRGVQVTDADGTVEFTTIYPGAYPGRWPHVHFEIYPDEAAATSGGTKLKTSQLAFPQDACEEAYATSSYSSSKANLAKMSLSTDMVFSDGVSQQLATVTGNATGGYTATLRLAV